MAQLSTKIQESLKAKSVNNVDFTTDVLLYRGDANKEADIQQ